MSLCDHWTIDCDVPCENVAAFEKLKGTTRGERNARDSMFFNFFGNRYIGRLDYIIRRAQSEILCVWHRQSTILYGRWHVLVQRSALNESVVRLLPYFHGSNAHDFRDIEMRCIHSRTKCDAVRFMYENLKHRKMKLKQREKCAEVLLM